eukprot:4756258-Alexandrium_andersonii.AAC.1
MKPFRRAAARSPRAAYGSAATRQQPPKALLGSFELLRAVRAPCAALRHCRALRGLRTALRAPRDAKIPDRP